VSHQVSFGAPTPFSPPLPVSSHAGRGILALFFMPLAPTLALFLLLLTLKANWQHRDH
jgi:hypothetical protein